MNCSMPGIPVLHCLLESAQTRVHWVGDAIQPSRPPSPPSPPTLNLSQHQSLFQWVSSLHQVACIRWPKYRSLSFSISPSSEYSGLIFFLFLGLTGLISLSWGLVNLSLVIGLEAKTGGGIGPEENQQCLTRQVPQGRPLQAPQADRGLTSQLKVEGLLLLAKTHPNLEVHCPHMFPFHFSGSCSFLINALL